jgi:hypothetical protein
VSYGAAGFSRDLDLLLLLAPDNLERLSASLKELQARRIVVPPFEPQYLEHGQAVHFRCSRDDVAGLRIDVMSKLRGVQDFEALWERRTTIESEGVEIDLMGIEDLVLAKKTQQDKDWPMIRLLLERHYHPNRTDATPERIDFWLRELRTPELLVKVAATHTEQANRSDRPAVRAALTGDVDAIAGALENEEREERRRDREYWAPLRRELEALRRAGRAN